MAVARPEEVVAPSELQISILSEKMSQNQWARMQGVLGVKTSNFRVDWDTTVFCFVDE